MINKLLSGIFIIKKGKRGDTEEIIEICQVNSREQHVLVI